MPPPHILNLQRSSLPLISSNITRVPTFHKWRNIIFTRGFPPTLPERPREMLRYPTGLLWWPLVVKCSHLSLFLSLTSPPPAHRSGPQASLHALLQTPRAQLRLCSNISHNLGEGIGWAGGNHNTRDNNIHLDIRYCFPSSHPPRPSTKRCQALAHPSPLVSILVPISTDIPQTSTSFTSLPTLPLPEGEENLFFLQVTIIIILQWCTSAHSKDFKNIMMDSSLGPLYL